MSCACTPTITLRCWQPTPTLAGALAQDIIVLARESGLRLETPPEVVLVADGDVDLHTMAVFAEHVSAVHQTTLSLTMSEQRPVRTTKETPQLPPAYLVVDGDRYIALDRSVINIGRRRDNTIVLDDRRVSRHHCQLRFRFGHFVLYDLASRGGTFVNGVRVSECVLRSGDVISLAGVKLVYMVDEGTTGGRPARGGDTQMYWCRPIRRKTCRTRGEAVDVLLLVLRLAAGALLLLFIGAVW
ncbi:MAG: hypothetical protein KatS3mg051_0543 [Anaerolineae bacterium]|nr:MAG: hypothetical protein KatS3mg051_0543 [Anaerolineae bacterium]